MVNQALVNFLRSSLQKGYSEESLRRGLLAKKWPIQEIEEAFLEIKKESHSVEPIQMASQPTTTQDSQSKKTQTKPTETKVTKEEVIKAFSKKAKSKLNVKLPKVNLPAKSALMIVAAFIIISLILSFTVLVYFYMSGLKDYTVVDPTTGEVLSKKCIEEDCSDMKSFALDFAKTKIKFAAIVGAIASALIVFGYTMMKQKKIYVWIVNLAYFLLLIIIFYMWITFTRA